MFIDKWYRKSFVSGMIWHNPPGLGTPLIVTISVRLNKFMLRGSWGEI